MFKSHKVAVQSNLIRVLVGNFFHMDLMITTGPLHTCYQLIDVQALLE